MRKVSAMVLGVVVVLAGAVVAGAWQTGKRLESVLQASIRATNQTLSAGLPGLAAAPSLELLSLERGLFSSTAHYRVTLADAESDEMGSSVAGKRSASAGELLFVDHIEHGPFPLSRVIRLQLLPVMATSNFTLQASSDVSQWFAASNGVAPLSGRASLDYQQNLSGTVQMQPLDFSHAGATLSSSGAILDFAVTDQHSTVTLDGRLGSLVFSAAEGTRVELQDLSLLSAGTLGESGLYLGHSDSTLKQLRVQVPEQPAWLLTNLRHQGQLGEDQTGVFGSFSAALGMLNYAGQDLGALSAGGSVSHLDTAAVKALNEFYSDRVTAPGAFSATKRLPNFDLTAPQQAQLQASIDRLLAGQPVVTLEHLALRTAHGESRFNLAMQLKQPDAYAVPASALLLQMLDTLEARLVLSQPMLKDLIVQLAAQDPAADPRLSNQQAQQMVLMATQVAVGSKLVVLEGGDLTASLNYAQGQVDFNGRKMPVEVFADLLIALFSGAALDTPTDSR
ncbi:MAG: YdgA family protein [Pseudomonas sp.]